MKPIEITTYQCPICNTEYSTEEEATKCLSQPEVTPSYKEGDIVYLTERYPRNRGKPFVKRKVTKVGGIVLEYRVHEVEYELNELVQIGRTCYVGREAAYSEDEYQLAKEDDFLRLGDPYYWDELIVVSPETVENWEEVL